MFRLHLTFPDLPLYSHVERYNIYYNKEQHSRDRHGYKLIEQQQDLKRNKKKSKLIE